MSKIRRTAIKNSATPMGNQKGSQKALLEDLVNFLDQNKAENIVTIDLKNRSAMTDQMIIATGTSARFISALASKLEDFLRAQGRKHISLEGMTACDWVLIDADDIVIHLFRPDIRTLYNLEKMWSE